MEKFLEYLNAQIEACKAEIAALEAAGRQDDAVFAKVRLNIYDVCKTVTGVHLKPTGGGVSAITAMLERFRTQWGEALQKAKDHGDAKNIAVEETKLAALADVIARFTEAAGI